MQPLFSTEPVSSRSARFLAFYLPQFHPIPENDVWWGKGFTEWTNVAKARPLFPGHDQPRFPADLGYYDLRVPEVREAQAQLARAHGVEAFCYYHYWFAGQRLLQRPFDEVLASGQPDFPFCICWANESWSGIWHGAPDHILCKQTYPGVEDERAHFSWLLRAFNDPRYVRVEGKPLFVIYNPHKLPEPRRVTDHWRTLAVEAGLQGLFILGHANPPWDPATNGFDGAVLRNLDLACAKVGWDLPKFVRWKRNWRREPMHVFDYANLVPHLSANEAQAENNFPYVIPNWDNTPRCGARGTVLRGATPALFGQHVAATVDQIQDKPPEKRLVFIKSWNEWAEGNYLEPDQRYGHGYLEALRGALEESAHRQTTRDSEKNLSTPCAVA